MKNPLAIVIAALLIAFLSGCNLSISSIPDEKKLEATTTTTTTISSASATSDTGTEIPLEFGEGTEIPVEFGD